MKPLAESSRFPESGSDNPDVTPYFFNKLAEELQSTGAQVYYPGVIKFLLWCILFVLCWPLALLALLLYPIVWVILLPFRLLGVVVGGVLDLVWSVITLPAVLVRRMAAHQH